MILKRILRGDYYGYVNEIFCRIRYRNISRNGIYEHIFKHIRNYERWKLIKDVVSLLLGLFVMSSPLMVVLYVVTDLRFGLIVISSMLATFYLVLFDSVMKEVRK